MISMMNQASMMYLKVPQTHLHHPTNPQTYRRNPRASSSMGRESQWQTPTMHISAMKWTCQECQDTLGMLVTISFLSHVFFLISVVCRPYFSFAPSYEETNHYLLAFPLYSSPLVFPLYLHRTVSPLDYLSRSSHFFPNFHQVLQPSP